MGVAWVFETDKTAVSIERHMIMFGAENLGNYTVDSLPYKPSEQGIAPFYILHHSNFPQSSFTLAPAENLKTSPRAVSDRGFDLILSKLSSGLQADTAGKFEVTGTEFGFRDFRVRVGMATQGTSKKGVIVEVEYMPSCIALQAIYLLTDFIEQFFPEQLEHKPEVLAKAVQEPYGAMETLYQYSVIFQSMRKKT